MILIKCVPRHKTHKSSRSVDCMLDRMVLTAATLLPLQTSPSGDPTAMSVSLGIELYPVASRLSQNFYIKMFDKA